MTSATPRPAGRVLIVDDEPAFLETFRLCLREANYLTAEAETTADGLRLAANQPFDACLLDRNVGVDSGLEALARLKQIAPDLPVAMITATGSTQAAMEALRAGADDYLVKPCLPEQLLIAVARLVASRRLRSRLEALERERPPEDELLRSESWRMQPLLETAREVARTDANVLLLGESGTGKGVLARAIHRWSARCDAQFVTIHTPSLSPELLESELFGHTRGAFTGATQSTTGRVAHADGGTLLLDEIGDFPPALQPKLLRFIQDKQYERVGDPATRCADVRIIAATNRDLAAMVLDKSFRQDLYYRLNVISLTVPPLRERPEDLSGLADHFLRRYAAAYRRPARGFAPAALRRLQDYGWPGNVRELQNVIERAVILCPDERIGPAQLALAGDAPAAVTTPGANISLDELERRHIRAVLARSDTLEVAARTLGIDTSTLYRKRKAYGLE